MLLLKKNILHKYDCFVIHVDSSRLHLTFVTVCLLSVVRKKIAKKIQLLRRPIRALDQIPDRFYVTSMEFLWKRRKRLSWQNIPRGQEREETAVFAGYQKLHLKETEIKGTAWKNVLELTQM